MLGLKKCDLLGLQETVEPLLIELEPLLIDLATYSSQATLQ